MQKPYTNATPGMVKKLTKINTQPSEIEKTILIKARDLVDRYLGGQVYGEQLRELARLVEQERSGINM